MKEQEVGRTLQMGVFGMARLPRAGRFSVVAGSTVQGFVERLRASSTF